MQLAKAMIRLRICAVWSETLLVTNTTLFEISCHGSNIYHKDHCFALEASSLNGDPERQIFLYAPHTNDGFFLLLTIQFLIHDPEIIKNIKFILLIQLKCGILEFILALTFQQEKIFIFQHFSFCVQLKFHAVIATELC